MNATSNAKWIALLLVAAVVPASATFHLMKVAEVFPGAALAPNAQYVVLRMYAPGQQFVAGHTVKVYSATGTLRATFTFPGNLPSGNNQDRILIATQAAEDFFGVTADLIASPSMFARGGKACFDAIDCVAWGNYSGNATGVGPPFNPTTGLVYGRAAIRRLDIAGSPTVLDSADDTNNSANDFVLGMPAPRNNAGAVGTAPGSTCGNGVIQGLEQCDDGNLTNGDGCSSTCQLQTVSAGVSITNVSVTEGNSGTKLATFMVKLSKPALSPVTYNIATSNGTAKAGSDFLAKSLFGESIPAGQTSRNFTVQIKGDTVKEPGENFKVTLSNVFGAVVTDALGIGTIVDNDSPLLSIADVSIAEGNSGTRLATFTARLSQPSASAVTYNIATANGTAVAGSDYVARSLVGQSIPAGTTSKAFAVTIKGDVAQEANETFKVNITNVSGVSLSDGLAIGTIRNDDGPTLSIADVSVTEGNSGTKLATFTVKLSKVAGTAVSYSIATANGTATAGSDYVARSLVGQSIPAGTTSKAFSVTIKGDTANEPDETFLVKLSNATGATVFDSQATGRIRNDELPSLSIANVSVSEGDSGTKLATFTVKLSRAATAAVRYNIATANGTATAPSDYVARSLAGQTIAAGASSRSFAVTLNGDAIYELEENFTVKASNVTGAKVVDGTAIGTIVNDDY